MTDLHHLYGYSLEYVTRAQTYRDTILPTVSADISPDLDFYYKEGIDVDNVALEYYMDFDLADEIIEEFDNETN